MIKGLQEARASLAKIVEEIKTGQQVASPLLDELGDEIIDVANQQTPVRTGRLVAGNKKQLVNNYTLRLYNEVEYAGFVHDGTSRQEPQPFMENAIDQVKERLPDLYARRATEFIEELE